MKSSDFDFEFESSDRSLKSFGESMVCRDLINLLRDWEEGEKLALTDMNFDDGIAEPSKIQGRISLAIYFATFLEILKEIEIEREVQDDT